LKYGSKLITAHVRLTGSERGSSEQSWDARPGQPWMDERTAGLKGLLTKEAVSSQK